MSNALLARVIGADVIRMEPTLCGIFKSRRHTYPERLTGNIPENNV